MLIAPGASVLIALSGGPDSVALFRCMLELAKKRDLRFDLRAAHLNHGIRGADADADEAFCVKLCRKFDVPLVRACAGTPKFSRTIGRSVELSARILRRMFLAQACEALNCQAVATAHHADDRIETVLYRICRGTGAAGLRGIGWTAALANPMEDEHGAGNWIEWREQGPIDVKSNSSTNPARIVRPLLSCGRAEVLAYLRSKQQRYCTDETNFDTGIPRNAIRKLVLPALEKKVHPGARAALWRLAEDAEADAAAQSLRRGWLLAFAEFGANRKALTLPAPDDVPLPTVEALSDTFDVLLTVLELFDCCFTRSDAKALRKLFAPRLGPRTLKLAHGVVAERRGKVVELQRSF